MNTGKLFVIGVVRANTRRDAHRTSATRDLALIVTGIGERVLVRDLTGNCTPRPFKHREAASIILARVQIQYPEGSWLIIDNPTLRNILGKPPTRKKRADVAYTHADHIHRADAERDLE